MTKTEYLATIVQTGTNAPVPTVGQNDFSEDFTYGYDDEGAFTINSANGVFLEGKTFLLSNNAAGAIYDVPFFRVSNNQLAIKSKLNNGVGQNGLFTAGASQTVYICVIL